MPEKTFGIGADIESITRFANPDIAQNASFLNKIFTKKELGHRHSNTITKYHLAVNISDIQSPLDETVNLTVRLDDLTNISVQPRMVTGGSIEIKNQSRQTVWSATIPVIPSTSSPTTSPTSGKPEAIGEKERY